MDDFNKPKIVYSEIVREPQFYLDKNGEFFAEATSFLMTGKYLEYLLILLHSKLATFAFKTYYAGGGLGETGYRYKKAFLELLPIIIPDKKMEQDLINIYENTPDKIDNFIGGIYGLSDSEMQFISDSVNS